MKVLIIGGGIAGLTVAVALRQRGFDCRVYEAAEAIKPVGAGITMASNAMRVFETLGLAEKVIKISCPINQAYITDEKLSPMQTTDFQHVEEKFGYGLYAMHRAKLQQVLLDELPADILSLGKRLKKLDQRDSTVTAYFEDGSKAEGEFLLGADGLHSRVRPLVYDAPLRYGGQTTWGGVAAVTLTDTFKNAAYEAWGGKARFGFVEIAPDKVYWYAALTTTAGEEDAVGVKQRLLGLFSSFADPVSSLIAGSPEDTIIRTDIFDIKPFQKWFEKRVCLIGDAAHPTTPNMGQGGAQAVEDAFFLANALAKSPEEPESAFRVFRDKRVRKASMVTQNSYFFGKIAHLERGRKLRDFVFRRVPPQVGIKQLEKILDVNIS